MIETSDAIERVESIRERVPWGRIANAVGLVVLLAIVVPFVIYAVPQVVGAEQSYVVLSGSMEPDLSPGDAIVVDEVAASAVEEGDVITFARDGDTRTTTHRVTGVVEQEGGIAFETKGDANQNADQQLVHESQLQGRVMTVGGYLFAIPLIGHVIQFASSQLGFVALVVVPIALFVLSEIREIVTSDDGGSTGDDEPGGGGRSADTDRQGDAGDGGALGVAGPGEPLATGDASASRDVSASPDGSASSGGGLTLRPAELELGLVVLGAFLGYSLWVAYVTFAFWAFGVAASVATGFLLLAGLYVTGGDTGSDERSGSSTGGAGADESIDRSSTESTTDASRSAPDDEPVALSELWETDRSGRNGTGSNGSTATDSRANEEIGPWTEAAERSFDEPNVERADDPGEGASEGVIDG